LYQLEVKLHLVQLMFNPANGWRVTVDVDPMERGRGGTHPVGKIRRAQAALRRLKTLGARIGPHDLYGRVDVVADHPDHGLRLVEVEGDSRKQREQALYSALGQLLLVMRIRSPHVRYGLAVPDTRQWRSQLRKIPKELRERLNLDLYAVRDGALTHYQPREEVFDPGKP
jgi:hypothetical protein